MDVLLSQINYNGSSTIFTMGAGTSFVRHFYTRKTEALPRQARDKHEEKLKKRRRRVCRALGLAQDDAELGLAKLVRKRGPLSSQFPYPHQNADDLPRQARDKQQKGQSLKTGRPFSSSSHGRMGSTLAPNDVVVNVTGSRVQYQGKNVGGLYDLIKKPELKVRTDERRIITGSPFFFPFLFFSSFVFLFQKRFCLVLSSLL